MMGNFINKYFLLYQNIYKLEKWEETILVLAEAFMILTIREELNVKQ
jgi:hypothetical protein